MDMSITLSKEDSETLIIMISSLSKHIEELEERIKNLEDKDYVRAWEK